MTYAEIKSHMYIHMGAKGLYNGESAAKPSLDIYHRGNGRNVQRACTPSGVSGWLPFVGYDVLSSSR